MPSPRHDSLNSLFRQRPELALEILHDLCGLDIPPDALARVESNDFNTRPSDDFTPDTVITAGPPQSPAFGVIVEIQYEKNERKRHQLVRYAMQLSLLLNRPAHVLVIAPNEAVAAFYATPVQTLLPGCSFRPRVLGPSGIPVITDAAEAAANIELALLSVMAHGESDERVVAAFMEALKAVPREKGNTYNEHCWNVSSAAIRLSMEKIMKTDEWPVFSPFAREHFTKGKEEGHAEGQVEALAGSVLMMLETQGVAVDAKARERILSCTDADLLRTWLKRTASAEGIEDVLG